MGNSTSEIVARACEASYAERLKSLNQDIELLHDTSVVFSTAKLTIRSDLARYKIGPEAGKAKAAASDFSEEALLFSQYDSFAARERNEAAVKSLIQSISQTTETDLASTEISKRLQAFCRVFEAILRADDLKSKKSSDSLSPSSELPTAAKAAIKFGLSTLLNLIECVAGVNPMLFELILNDANSALSDSFPLSLATSDSTLIESFERISDFFDSVACGKIKSLSESGSLASLLPLFKLALSSGSISSFMLFSRRLLQMKDLSAELRTSLFPLLKSLNSVPLMHSLFRWGAKNRGDALEVVEDRVMGGIDNDDGVVYIDSEFENISVYVEILVVQTNENCHFGVSVPEFNEKSAWNNSSYTTFAYGSNSSVYTKADESFKMTPWAAGDIIGVLVDNNAKTVTFFKNGEKQPNPPLKFTQDKYKVYLHINKDCEFRLNKQLEYPEELASTFLITKPSISAFQDLLKSEVPSDEFLKQPVGEIVSFLLKKLADGLLYVEYLFQSRNFKFQTKSPSYSFQLTRRSFKSLQELQQDLYNLQLSSDHSIISEAALVSAISSIQRLVMFSCLLAEQTEDESLEEETKKKILNQTIAFIQNSKNAELSDEAMKLLSSCFEIFYKDPSVKLSYINEALERDDQKHELQVFEELEAKIFSTIARPDKLFPILKYISDEHVAQVKRFYKNLIHKAQKVTGSIIRGEKVKVSALKLLSSAQAALFSQAGKEKFDEKHLEVISDYSLTFLSASLSTLKESNDVLRSKPSEEVIQLVSTSLVGTILDELLNSLVLSPLTSKIISEVLPLVSDLSGFFSGVPAGQTILAGGIGVIEEVYESPHNYPDSANLKHSVTVPGALKYTLVFDPQCKTENGCDYLELWLDEATTNKFARWEGESFPKEPVEVTNPSLHFTFRSDGSVNYWGWKISIKALVETSFYKKQWPETSKDSIEFFFSRCAGKMVRGEVEDFQVDAEVAKALNNPLLEYGISDQALVYVQGLPKIEESVESLSKQILKPAEYLVSPALRKFSFLPNYEIGLKEYLEYYQGEHPKVFCSNLFLSEFVEGTEALVAAWTALRKKSGITGHHLNIGGNDLDQAERAVFAVYSSFFEISDTVKAVLSNSLEAGATIKSFVKEACNIRYWAQKQKQKLVDGGKAETSYKGISDDVVKKCAILVGSDYKSSLNHIGISKIMKNLVQNIAKGQKTHLKLASKWKNVQDALKSAKKLTSLVSIKNKSTKAENEDLKEFSRVVDLVKLFLENPAPVEQLVETLNKHRTRAIVRALGFLSISKLISFSSSEHETFIVKSFSESLTRDGEKLSYSDGIQGVDPVLSKSVQTGFFLVVRSIQEDLISSAFSTLNLELFSHFSTAIEALTWKYRGEDLHLLIGQPLTALLKTLLKWAKGDFQQEKTQGKFLTDKCVTRIGLLTEEAVPEGKTKVLVDKPEGQPGTFLVIDFGGTELPITQFVLTDEVREDLEEAVPEFQHAGSGKRVYVYRNEPDPAKEYLTGINEDLSPKFEKYEKLLGDPDPEELKRVAKAKENFRNHAWKLFKQLFYTLAGAWKGSNENTHLIIQQKFLKVLFSELRTSLDLQDANFNDFSIEKLASGEVWINNAKILREKPRSDMEVWMELFAQDSHIELAELVSTYRGYIDPLLTGSVPAAENEELVDQASIYKGEDGEIRFSNFVSLVHETFSQDESLEEIRKSEENKELWKELKNNEKIINYDDFHQILKDLEKNFVPSSENLFGPILDLFKTHGKLVPAEPLKGNFADLVLGSGELGFYETLTKIKNDSKFSNILSEISSFYLNHPDLPEAASQVEESRKATNDYLSSLLLVIYGGFTSSFLSKSLSGAEYVKVLLGYLRDSRSIQILTLVSRILAKVLPSQHSPSTIQTIWTSLDSSHENLAQFLLNMIGKSITVTEDQRASYEARNLLISLIQEPRWTEHLLLEISKVQSSSVESLNKGQLLDCIQIGSVLVMTNNFSIGRNPSTLSVVSLKDSSFPWGIIKTIESDGKFSVYSIIDDNSIKVEPSKITSIENAVKGNFFRSLESKGSSICDNLFSIWTALNASFSKPLRTEAEGFAVFSVVYKTLQSVVITALKDALEVFELDHEKLSIVLADLIDLKPFKENYSNSEFNAARSQIKEKVKSLLEDEKPQTVEEINEQANLLDEDSKNAYAALQQDGLSPSFALKCVKAGIKDFANVANFTETVQSSLLSKLSLIDDGSLAVEDPDGQAEIYQNNFYHLIISDSHNSHKSLEFDISSKVFDSLKTFTDEVTIRIGIECSALDNRLRSGVKVGSLDLSFTSSTPNIDQVTVLRIIANANGSIRVTNETNSEVFETFNRSVFTGFSIGKIQAYLTEGSLMSIVMLEVHNKAINTNFQGKIEKALKSDMSERFVKIRSRGPESYDSRLKILGLSSEQVEQCKSRTESISEAIHYSLKNFQPSNSLTLAACSGISELKIFDTPEQVLPEYETVKVFENFSESDFVVPGRKVLAFKRGTGENFILGVSIGETAGFESLGELTTSGDGRTVPIYTKTGKVSQKDPGINSIIFIKCNSINNVPVPRNYSIITDKEGKAINIAPKTENPFYLFMAFNKTAEYLGIPVLRLESILPKFTTFGLVESAKSSGSDKKEKPADYSSYSLTSLYSLLFTFEHNSLVRESESLISSSLQKSLVYFESLVKLVPMSKLFLFLDSPFVKKLDFSLSNESLITSLAYESISSLVCTLIPKGSSGRLLKSVFVESTHPYDNNMDVDDVISIPGASSLRIEFDSQCYTENGCDPLRFYESSGRSGEIRCLSGQGESAWQAFEVPGDTVYTYFHSDGSVNYWGYKFEVIPLGASGVAQKTNSAVALEVLARTANDENFGKIVSSDQFLFPLFAYLLGSPNLEEKLVILDILKVSAKRLTSPAGKEIVKFLGTSAEALYKTTSADKTSHNVLQALIQVLFECKKAGGAVINANWFQDLTDLLSDMHGLGEKESTLEMYLFDIFKGTSAAKLEIDFESEHPYPARTQSKEIRVSGASSLALSFSKDSKADKNHTVFFSRQHDQPDNILNDAGSVNVKSKFETKGPDIEFSNDGLRVTRTNSNGWGAALIGVKLTSGCTSFTYFIENDGGSEYLYIGFVQADEASNVDLASCFNSDLGKKLFTWKKNGDMHRHLSNTNVSTFATGDTLRFDVNFEQGVIVCYKNGAEVYTFNDICTPLIPLLSFGGSNQFVQLKSIETANETSIESKLVTISGDFTYLWFPVNAGYFNKYSWQQLTDEKISVTEEDLKATNLTEEVSFLSTNLEHEGGQHYFQFQVKKGQDMGIGVAPPTHLASKTWDNEEVFVFWGDSPALSVQENDVVGLLLDLDSKKLELFKNRVSVLSITDKPLEGSFGFFSVLKSKDSEVVIKNEEPAWLDILTLNTDRTSAELGYKIKVVPVFKGRTQGAMDNFLKSSSQEFRESWNNYRNSLIGFFRSGAVEELVMFIDQFSASKGKDPAALTQEDLTINKTDLIYYPELEKVEEGNVFKLYQILQDFNKRVQSSLYLFDLNFKAELTDLQRFLIASRSFVFFDIKNKLLKAVLDKTKNDTRTEINIDRPKAARHRNKKEVDVEGQFSIFGQIFRAMSAVSNSGLRNSERIYKVNYRGEGSIDAGGPYNESMSNMCDELMSSFLRLLVPTSNNTNNMGEYRDAWIVNPSATSETDLEMFTFLGKLMGAAIRTQNNLNLSLPPIFWKSLLRERLSVKDLKTMDLCTVTIFEILKNPESNELTPDNFSMVYDEKFTTKNSAGKEVEVVPGGRDLQVTYENSKEFAALALETRLNESSKIYEAIRAGLSAVVPVDYLNLMSFKQLETLVCGAPNVDIDILKENTDYEGCALSDQHIVYFWEVLKAFGPRDRTLFLKFVWGRTKLPSGKDWRHMKVTRLNPSGPVNNYMPISHTCFFTLDLPAYTTKEAMEQKLLYAITHCTAIDLDGRAGDGWEDND